MSAPTLEFYVKGLLDLGVVDPNDEIYKYLSPVDPIALKALVDQLNRERASTTTLIGSAKKSWTSQKGQRVGSIFEKLIREIFLNSKVFDVSVNVHSTTGEIDFRLTLKSLSNKIPFLVSRTHILGEAKCHDKSPKSEWVTEMMGNLTLHSTDLGIIFVYCTPRKLAREFRQAIAMGAVARQYVMPLGQFQINELVGGKQLLHIMTNQYTSTASHGSELHV
jgi:hypothetical protein